MGAIDDDRMLLGGLASWLAPIDDVVVAVMAPTVDAYLEQALRMTRSPESPDTVGTAGAGAAADVVLLDLNLRDHTYPADNVRRVAASGARVLVVSTIPDPAAVVATIEAGAAGYITKDQDLSVLVDAIRTVASGGEAVTPELAFALSRDDRPNRPTLSPQERAVLTAHASGLTLASAARRAGVAYGTAREYLERVKRKYTEAGRPTATKLDLANRVREDAWDDRPPLP